MKRICGIILVVTFTIALVLSGYVSTNAAYKSYDKEQLNRTSIVLFINKSKTGLVSMTTRGTATIRVCNSTAAPKFKSSDKKIATIDSSGKVQAVKAGKCKMTVTVGSKKYTCKVTVKNNYSDKTLKKYMKVTAKKKGSVVEYKIVNKFSHPMNVTVKGNEIATSGATTVLTLDETIPGKSTVYYYDNLSDPLSGYERTSITYGYPGENADSLIISSEDVTVDFSEVSVAPGNISFYGKDYQVAHMTATIKNNLPFGFNFGYSPYMSSLDTYIVFYKGDTIVASARFNPSAKGPNSGETIEKTVDSSPIYGWDGTYDTYKIVHNSFSILFGESRY